MKYIFVVLAALVIGSLAIAAPVRHSHAAPPAHWDRTHHNRPTNVHPIAPIGHARTVVKNYHLVNGHKFKFGFFYNGWNHNHWSFHYYDTRYGAYLYYDPYALQYYYWCAPQYRYYPITYAPLGYVFPYEAEPVAPTDPIPDPPAEPPTEDR